MINFFYYFFNLLKNSDPKKVIFEPSLKLDTSERYIERTQLLISLSEFQEQLTLWEPPEGFEAITLISDKIPK